MTNCNIIAALSLICLIFLSCASVSTKRQNSRKYLLLSDVGKLRNPNQRHIEIIQSKLGNSEFTSTDKVTFNKLGLNDKEKVIFLGEYFSFYGDTTVSDNFFPVGYGRSANRLEILKKKIRYPIEVEALYSMTAMLFEGSVIISPVLINKRTREICNFKRQDVDEVYKIYREWFKKMKSNNLNKLSWPLKGTQYKWLGEDVVNEIEPLLEQSF